MLNECDVDFDTLSPETVCNQFEGIHNLTTKQGLCDLSKDGHLINEDMNEIMPRSYNLGDPIHRDEFIDDFRLTSALNLLKMHFLSRIHTLLQASESASCAQSIGSTGPSVDEKMLKMATVVCIWYIQIRRDGLWPGVDEGFHISYNSSTIKNSCNTQTTNSSSNRAEGTEAIYTLPESPLSDEHWHSLMQFSYQCVRNAKYDPDYDRLLSRYFKGDLGEDYHLRSAIKRHFTPLDYRIRSILQTFAQQLQCAHFFVDGYRNLWVGKSPDSSCGIGIRIFYKLEDILDFERGMSGRTVQKYLEAPLLSVPKQLLMYPFLPNSDSDKSPRHDAGWKFDLRIWVLVTSMEADSSTSSTFRHSQNNSGVQAYIYDRIYGRRCGTSFTLDAGSLSQPYVHLTNYSVQKKKFQSNSNGTGISGGNNSTSVSNNSISGKRFSMVHRLRSARQQGSVDADYDNSTYYGSGNSVPTGTNDTDASCLMQQQQHSDLLISKKNEYFLCIPLRLIHSIDSTHRPRGCTKHTGLSLVTASTTRNASR